jgi:predicted acyltransferase
MARKSIIKIPYMNNASERLVSLDFFRGLTMFLLIAEFANMFPLFLDPQFLNTPIHFIGVQLHHCDWAGLHFWDLIQPFFMFIVGVSIPLSFARRSANGESNNQLLMHVLKRSLLLLILGWALYCIEPGRITFRFQNVLAQLSVTYLLAYLVMKKAPWFQILFSVILVGISEGVYRFFPLDGFNHPFVAGENFGTWSNLLISGETGEGNWAIFNAIPTTAHTIWGVLAGGLLSSDRSQKSKLKILVISGLIALAVGYAISVYTPIIKRIATSSFIFTSGGYTILMLAFCYWLIDMLQYRKGINFFSIVGMNPLFIYLFAHVGGAALLTSIVSPFSMPLFGLAGPWMAQFATSLIVLFLLWYLCYWLYKRRIFIRI